MKLVHFSKKVNLSLNQSFSLCFAVVMVKRGFSEEDQMIIESSGIDVSIMSSCSVTDVVAKANKVLRVFGTWKRLVCLQFLFWGLQERFGGDMDSLKMFKERRTNAGHEGDPMSEEDIKNQRRKALREEVQEAKKLLDAKKAALKKATPKSSAKAKTKGTSKPEPAASASASSQETVFLIQKDVDAFFPANPSSSKVSHFSQDWH